MIIFGISCIVLAVVVLTGFLAAHLAAVAVAAALVSGLAGLTLVFHGVSSSQHSPKHSGRT